MRSGHQWIAEYSESHRNPTNKLIHWICVPTIMWTVLALLWVIPMPQALQFHPLFNWALVFVAIAQLFYLSFGWKIFSGMLLTAAVMLGLCYFIEQHVNLPLWQIALVVFVLAWIGQFIGHHIEGKKPSFLKDLLFLLVGPAWEMNYFMRKIGFIK
ncbi:MAG: DUF962 domain-containing protein [Kangiellaceae bacterium]|nr:DUF962 domain-containing protein [Kangiellaceae bacterium]